MCVCVCSPYYYIYYSDDHNKNSDILLQLQTTLLSLLLLKIHTLHHSSNRRYNPNSSFDNLNFQHFKRKHFTNTRQIWKQKRTFLSINKKRKKKKKGKINKFPPRGKFRLHGFAGPIHHPPPSSNISLL